MSKTQDVESDSHHHQLLLRIFHYDWNGMQNEVNFRHGDVNKKEILIHYQQSDGMINFQCIDDETRHSLITYFPSNRTIYYHLRDQY